MFEVLLHSGTGHPELTWILVAGVAALSVGVAIGLFSDRVRSWFVADREDSPSRE
ncbi:hypothetical protein [Salinarchaeum chitinilyticum]